MAQAPPNDEDITGKLPPDARQNASLVEHLIQWIKAYPEKLAEILLTISSQVLESLPAPLRKQIKAMQTAAKKTTREPKDKKPEQTKARDQELIVNLQAAKDQDKTQEKPIEKPQEQKPEKQQKPADKQPDKQEKQPEKKSTAKPAKPAKPPRAKGGKGGKPDNSAELAALLLQEEKRQQEAQKTTSGQALPTAVIGGQQDKAATMAAKHIVDYAAQHGVNVNPASLSNDKAVTPMAAQDANALSAANAKKGTDGRGA